MQSLLSTNNIYHYTDIETIIKILKNGFRASYCEEDYSFLKLDLPEEISKQKGVKVKIKMICFCDIPINLNKTHSVIYGNCAIGVTKEFAIRNNISPVLYIPNQVNTNHIFYGLLNYSINNKPKTYKKVNEKWKSKINDEYLIFSDCYNAYNLIDELLGYVKPFEGYYKHEEKEYKNYRFYDEREWRYITKTQILPDIINIKDNVKEKYEYLKFEENDITDIYIPKKEIECIKKRLKEDNLNNYIDKLITK